MNKRIRILELFETPVLLCLLLFAISIATVSIGGGEAQRTVTEIFIRVVVVVGLYIFIGNSGLMSFGHVSFMCIGAYCSAWLTLPQELKAFTLTGLPQVILEHSLSPVTATLLSASLAALIAFVSGLVLMRLSGIAISIATFAVLAIVNVIYSNWESVTGGTSSVVGVPTTVDIWTALGWSCLAVFAAHIHGRSGWGLQLRALREESTAARACGVNLYRVALIAFVLSAAVVGVGGAMHAQFLGVVNPDEFYLGQTFLFLSMLVIGGMSSLTGAVFGAVILSAFVEVLVRLEQGVSIFGFSVSLPGGTQEVALGLAMILTLLVRPKGWVGQQELKLVWPFR